MMSLKTYMACGLVAGVAMASGCGRSTGPERYDVRGAVTFRGEPVPSGTITFEPDLSKSNSGPVSVIPIIDGKYDSLALERPGPLAGSLIVRISGYPAPDPDVEIQPPLFPEYRTTVNLATSQGATGLDFDVPERSRKRGDSRP
jgi:hypothetical protein